MIKTISISQSNIWDNIVKSIPNADVYYLSGYVKAFQYHGDGEPILFFYENGIHRAVCVMMKRDIADEKLLEEAKLPSGRFFDLITPYGYGGFVFDNHEVDTHTIVGLNTELLDFLKCEGYISAFFRFHPLLDNAHLLDGSTEVIDLGKTIAIDLTSPEIIWQNITSKNRNVIRKAEKNGVEIRHGKGLALLKEFRKIYDETMKHDNAEDYYYFKNNFYKSIADDLYDNYEVFYSIYEEDIIAISIIIFSGSSMHYHLSGSKYEYRNLAPSNLLLYKAALWGNEHGFKTLHLGGGVGSGEDNLYKFKAAFNRNSDYQFSIGKLIVNKEIYDELVAMRGFQEKDKNDIRFFPQYRANTSV